MQIFMTFMDHLLFQLSLPSIKQENTRKFYFAYTQNMSNENQIMKAVAQCLQLHYVPISQR